MFSSISRIEKVSYSRKKITKRKKQLGGGGGGEGERVRCR